MAKISSFASLTDKLDTKDQARYGRVLKGDSLQFIPTGSVVMDKLAGIGGIPLQRITQIVSEPGCGKSTVALTISASCQRVGGKVLYLDFEQAMTSQYAELMGCDLDSGTMLLYQPTDLDAAWDLILRASDLGCNLIILDSIAGMFPRVEDEDMANLKANIGFQAKGLGLFFPRVKSLARVKNLAVVAINQVRAKIAFGWGAGIQKTPAYSHELPGGWAPKFYTDLMYFLEIRKTEKIKTDTISGTKGNVYTGQELFVSTWKNKVGMPFRKASMYLQFGEGINDMRSVSELGVSLDIITLAKNGFWSIISQGDYLDTKIGETILSGRGIETLHEEFIKNPLIFDYVRRRVLDLDFVEVMSPEDTAGVESLLKGDGDMDAPSSEAPAMTPPPIPVI